MLSTKMVVIALMIYSASAPFRMEMLPETVVIREQAVNTAIIYNAPVVQPVFEPISKPDDLAVVSLASIPVNRPADTPIISNEVHRVEISVISVERVIMIDEGKSDDELLREEFAQVYQVVNANLAKM